MASESPSGPAALLQRLRAGIGRLWERLAPRRVSWGSIALGAAIAPVALWPLVSAAWSLLGLTGLQALQVAAAIVSALLLVAGVVGLNRGRTNPVHLVWLILAAWLVAGAAVAALTTVAWWLLGTPTWRPPDTLTPASLDAIATRAFAVIAGLGGVALLAISYRRQRTTENTDQREQTRLFTERFDIASEKLGSEQPAVRLAGVHALAHLADDAPPDRDDLVQMVIDVLCAYLRMPYEPAPEELPEDAADERSADWQVRWQTFAAFREVRHSVVRIISNRLQRNTRWQGKVYDFTGVTFDGGSFGGASFSGGKVSFSGAKFVSGVTGFSSAKFTGGRIDFSRATFSGGATLFLFSIFSGAKVDFTGAEFNGGSVNFLGSKFKSGEIDFTLSRFKSGHVDFSRTKYLGANVIFAHASFTEGVVDFTAAEFVDGIVDFTNIPVFKTVLGQGNSKEATGVCPAGLWESVAAGATGVVVLPEAWRNKDWDASSNRIANEITSSEEEV